MQPDGRDVVLAIIVLVLLSPLMVLIAIVVSMDSPGPIFHHRRVLGRSGREFDALKFRTMYVNGNDILDSFPELRDEFESSQKLKRDPRVTPIGRILRKYSLDELPQLFNVLLGQMSLVGPRMITPGERQKYGKMSLTASFAINGNIGQANYVASKAGILGLTRTLALEWAPDRITVNAVAPSLIETDMTDAARLSEHAARIPVGRMGTVDEVAQMVVMVIGNPYVTGQTVALNGGLHFA